MIDRIMKLMGYTKTSELRPRQYDLVNISPFGRVVHFMNNEFVQSAKTYKPKYWKHDYSRQSIRQALAIARWQIERRSKDNP